MFLSLLKIRLPKKYPQEAPNVSIQNAVGLPEEKLQSIGSIVRSKVQDLVGTEMVFEVIEYVKEELESYLDSYKSFYEDYQLREKKKEISDLRKIQIDEKQAMEESKRVAERVEREVQSRKEKLERDFIMKPADNKKLLSLENPVQMTGLTHSSSVYYFIKGPCTFRGIPSS